MLFPERLTVHGGRNPQPVMITRSRDELRLEVDASRTDEPARPDSTTAQAVPSADACQERASDAGNPRSLHSPPPCGEAHTRLVGERCNTDGSERFRALFLAGDFDGIAEIAMEQVQEGARMLDVRVSIPGRNEAEDMSEIVRFLRTRLGVPLMIDTTDPQAAEAALAHGGKDTIINSADFALGEDRVDEFLHLCRRHGLSLVALTIDEEGPAATVQRKLSIVRRVREHARRVGVGDDRLIFDPLVFPLVSCGDGVNAAAETLNAVRRIKERFPRCRTCLGVSNISHGLAPKVRAVFETVFLHHASTVGLDFAIVNTRRLKTAPRLDGRVRVTAEYILFGGMDRQEALPLLRTDGLSTAGE